MGLRGHAANFKHDGKFTQHYGAISFIPAYAVAVSLYKNIFCKHKHCFVGNFIIMCKYSS